MDGRGQRSKRAGCDGDSLKASSKAISIGIVGGGLVGALAAVSLAKACKAQNRAVTISVFERFGSPSLGASSGVGPETSQTRSVKNQYEGQYDARNLVLSSMTVAFFESLGIWEEIQEHLVPIESLRISRRQGRGRSCIRAKDEGVKALGYVADMAHLAVQLTGLAQSQQEVQFHFNTELTKLVPLQAGYAVQYAQNEGDQKEAHFDLLVAADGQNSWVCKTLGLQASGKAYEQHALVTNVSMDRPMPHIAYEQFIDGGAITLLPLTQSGFPNRMALVWIDAPEKLHQLQSLSEPEFLQQLAQYLPLDAVYAHKGKSKIYPLQYQLRDDRVRPHLVVIGNAAQSLHPIAAQGFNLAVRDIRDFVQLVAPQLRGNQPVDTIFSGAVMQQFSRQRATDVRKVRGFVDLLNQAFFTKHKTPVLGILQDTALLGFELIPGAKAALSRFAMGGRSR